MYLSYSRFLVLFASFVITVGLYSQVFKLFRTKSAKDFSTSLIIALLVNELAWLNYGIALREWPIIIVDLASLPADIAIMVGYCKWGGQNGNREGLGCS